MRESTSVISEDPVQTSVHRYNFAEIVRYCALRDMKIEEYFEQVKQRGLELFLQWEEEQLRPR